MRRLVVLVIGVLALGPAACQSRTTDHPVLKAANTGLQARLTCQEPALLNQVSPAQAARLAGDSALRCRIRTQGGPSIDCHSEGDVRLFGLPAWTVSVLPPDGIERGLSVELQADATTVATAAGAALRVPMRPRGDGGYGYVGLGADGGDYRVRPRRDGSATFGCALPAPASEAALPPLQRPPGWAVLSGSVSYPSEHFPAMRVCALDPADPGRGYCVQTIQGDPHYRLTVPAGAWWLLAWPQDAGGDGAPGRRSQASDCIAEARSGCDAHALQAVEIAADELRYGIDINDWYADPRTDSPPMEPAGAPMPR